ncbi:hypothetical protein pb186bvf_018331 [Paramecium bursaria]
MIQFHICFITSESHVIKSKSKSQTQNHKSIKKSFRIISKVVQALLFSESKELREQLKYGFRSTKRVRGTERTARRTGFQVSYLSF